jgi:membrane protein implicated in regulation of membrane protease activity
MNIWHIWVIVALVLVILEIFTSGFAVICISVGCLFGAGAAALDWELKWQLLTFAIFTAMAFLTVRPLFCKLLYKKSHEVKTNADALIGRRAIVTERIKSEQHPGRVKVDGDDWKAIPLDNNAIEVNEVVEITALNSIIVTVKKL